MPVTVKVAAHGAEKFDEHRFEKGKPSLDLLKSLAGTSAFEIEHIVETRLGQQTSLRDETLRDLPFRSEKNGLVMAAYQAYSSHQNLVLRPEDVWFAILTQFSFYVNANAEELRSSFVAHKDKKLLELRDPDQQDMATMCYNMAHLIDANVVDPLLREWIMPSFTTTTPNDEVIAAVIMMGTLQKYFEYSFVTLTCGIPSVKLLGEQEDWENILHRIEKLSEYGEQPTRFCALLRPLLHNIVYTFTAPPGDATVTDFWSRIISIENMSGGADITGWIVAFCFWDEKGKCLHRAEHPPLQSAAGEDNKNLHHQCYHRVGRKDIPMAQVSVPVLYRYTDDHGFDVSIKTKLFAGSVGFTVSTATEPIQVVAKHEDDLNTVQPLSAWWMYKIDEEAKAPGRQEQYRS